MSTHTNYWILTSGRWTERELDAVVRELHRQRCSTFDGGHRNRKIKAGPMTKAEQARHEKQVLSVIDALEHSGFKVERR